MRPAIGAQRRGSRGVAAAMLAVLLAAGAPAPAGTPDGAPVAAPGRKAVELTRVEPGPLLGLRVDDGRLAEAMAALERELGCEIRLGGSLGERRLSAVLSARIPERLLLALARRVEAEPQVAYHLRPREAGAPPGPPPPWYFARDPAPEGLPASLELEAAVALLRGKGVPLELEGAEEPRGTARLPRTPAPLHAVLAALCRAGNLTWRPVITLQPRRAVDQAAEEDERRHAQYAELNRLTPEERREEFEAEISAALALPPEQRAVRLGRLAADLDGLGTLLRRTPAEHREGFARRIAAIGADCGAALQRVSPARRGELAPVLASLRALEALLRAPS